jgi:hypothetical protein
MPQTREGINVNVLIKTLVRGSLLQTAAWCTLGSGASIGLAQAPAEPVSIEMWHGVRRIDVPTRPPEAPKTVSIEKPSNDKPAAPVAVVVPAHETTPAAQPAAGVIILGNYTVPGDPRTGNVVRAAVAIGQEAQKGEATPTPKTSDSVPPAELAPLQSLPLPPRAEPSQEPAPVRTSPVHESIELGVLGAVPLPVFYGAAAVFVTPFLCVCLFLYLLRRAGGPLLRIEYVNHHPAAYQGVVLGPMPTGVRVPATPTTAPVVRNTTLTPEPESTAEQFELGPTYDEELKSRQDQEQHQEQAVLRQLFEDNLKLRRDVAEMHNAGA